MKGIKDGKERGKRSRALNVWPQGPPDYIAYYIMLHIILYLSVHVVITRLVQHVSI